MFGTYFYNETIKRCVSVFGTMFNNIDIKKTKADGTVLTTTKVPISYGPSQKFIDRLAEEPNLSDNNRSAISLPRMAFELTGFNYDAQRQQNKLIRNAKTVIESDNTNRKFQYAPAPYDLNFTLSILAKNQTDALQIVEQILPFFQPDYTVTINVVPELNIKRDIPIVLNSVSYEDTYEGDFSRRRAVIYTLGFTAKTYLFGPASTQKVIKETQSDLYTDTDTTNKAREMRIVITPNPTTADADDDFGFTTTITSFTDSKNYNPSSDSDE